MTAYTWLQSTIFCRCIKELLTSKQGLKKGWQVLFGPFYLIILAHGKTSLKVVPNPHPHLWDGSLEEDVRTNNEVRKTNRRREKQEIFFLL